MIDLKTKAMNKTYLFIKIQNNANKIERVLRKKGYRPERNQTFRDRHIGVNVNTKVIFSYNFHNQDYVELTYKDLKINNKTEKLKVKMLK